MTKKMMRRKNIPQKKMPKNGSTMRNQSKIFQKHKNHTIVEVMNRKLMFTRRKYHSISHFSTCIKNDEMYKQENADYTHRFCYLGNSFIAKTLDADIQDIEYSRKTHPHHRQSIL